MQLLIGDLAREPHEAVGEGRRGLESMSFVDSRGVSLDPSLSTRLQRKLLASSLPR